MIRLSGPRCPDRRAPVPVPLQAGRVRMRITRGDRQPTRHICTRGDSGPTAAPDRVPAPT